MKLGGCIWIPFLSDGKLLVMLLAHIAFLAQRSASESPGSSLWLWLFPWMVIGGIIYGGLWIWGEITGQNKEQRKAEAQKQEADRLRHEERQRQIQASPEYQKSVEDFRRWHEQVHGESSGYHSSTEEADEQVTKGIHYCDGPPFDAEWHAEKLAQKALVRQKYSVAKVAETDEEKNPEVLRRAQQIFDERGYADSIF